MGHDISAYKGNVVDSGNGEHSIAYLQRGAFNSKARELYKALDAEDCDNGCSGCGEDRYFTEAQLKAALEKIPHGDDFKDEREFLQICVDQGEAGATVGFW
jgi:hypothetical protein